MRLTLAIGCLLAIVVSGTGCVNSRPIHYYTVGTPPAPPVPPSTGGPSVLVGAVLETPMLQDGRIHYRVGSNEVGAYQLHRWAEEPGTMVRNSLVKGLRSTGRYRSVVESGSSAAGDYLLHGKLLEFDEVDGATIQTRISLRVELVDVKTKQVVWEDLIERDEPVREKNVRDVVASLDHNLQEAVRTTVAKVGESLAARP